MDRKSIIILAVAIAVYIVVSRGVDHLYPPKPIPVSAPVATHAAPAIVNKPGPIAPLPTRISSSGPEQFLTVTNAQLICRFTSRGGGLKDVDLKDYPAVIKPGPRSTNTTLAGLNHNAPLPVLALIGNGLDAGADFALSREGNVVRAEKTLTNGLQIIKEFELGNDYLIKARLRVVNTTGHSNHLSDRGVVVGTATAIGTMDDPTAMGVIWYNGVKSQKILDSWFANRTLGCFPGTPRSQYAEGAGDVVWAAAVNQFFTLAAIPSNAAPRLVIDKIEVPPPSLSGPTNSMTLLLTNGYQTSLVYPAVELAPHAGAETSIVFYVGPKEYNRLAKIGQRMGNKLDLIMDFTGIFGFVSKMLLLSMNGLHEMGFPYGLTIIVITIIIKVVFWPLTIASTKSQKRMQTLQPQIKAIADKYKDDPTKKNEKTMEFYKQHKINPMGACLPTLIQLPVFIGFYYMLRGAIELRGASFLWAFDLSQPDTVFVLGGFPINPMPLIMGATQLWQSHTTPPSPGMEPSQQKLMRWMPALMIAIFYRMSAGLNLYWTVSNLLGILQLKLTRSTDEPAAATVPGPAKKKR
jgi:YidC/Oxa1 family membrane protein insertase